MKKLISYKLLVDIVLILITIILTLTTNTKVFAIETEIEVSEDFKKWLELPDEERQNILMPRVCEIPKTQATYTNPFYYGSLLKSSFESKYDLRNVIPENMVIKNQMSTGSCWAFGALASLETNLAMNNYYKGILAKEYDFSERHLEYATSNTFINGDTYKYGLNRTAGLGGSWAFAEYYFGNGTGPILEESMTFVDGYDKIDLSEFENHSTVAQVFDTKIFPSYKVTEDTTEIKNLMKDYIQKNGGISAGIHGAQLLSEYYNNKTGAIYCDDATQCQMNHMVLIIGWDDNYAVENFNENHRPSKKGAWIVKNSWGVKQDQGSVEEVKNILFKANKESYEALGWTDSSMLPDTVITNIRMYN